MSKNVANGPFYNIHSVNDIEYAYHEVLSIRHIPEGQSTLTPLEAALLDHIDELNNFGDN